MAGYIRELNGHFYIRTRVRVIVPETGEARWKQVEKAAGTSKRAAQRMLKDLQCDVDTGVYVPTNMTVLLLGQKWLREHVQANLKPATATRARSTSTSPPLSATCVWMTASPNTSRRCSPASARAA